MDEVQHWQVIFERFWSNRYFEFNCQNRAFPESDETVEADPDPDNAAASGTTDEQKAQKAAAPWSGDGRRICREFHQFRPGSGVPGEVHCARFRARAIRRDDPCNEGPTTPD